MNSIKRFYCFRVFKTARCAGVTGAAGGATTTTTVTTAIISNARTAAVGLRTRTEIIRRPLTPEAEEECIRRTRAAAADTSLACLVAAEVTVEIGKESCGHLLTLSTWLVVIT